MRLHPSNHTVVVITILSFLVIFFANASFLKIGDNSLLPNRKDYNDPELTGPDRLCIIYGSVIGDFFGAGDPETDVYYWKIYSPSGELLFEGSGGERYQTVRYTFSLIGKHRVELIVERAGDVIKTDHKEVELIQGPIPLLEPHYSICENQEIELQAIDPASAGFEDYIFKWTDENGQDVSTDNTYKTSEVGKYEVEFYFINENGEEECRTQLSTTIELSSSFTVTASAADVCPGGSISFSSDPSVTGDWYYQKDGSSTRNLVGAGNSITIKPEVDLDGAGDYLMFLTVSNPNNPGCTLEKSLPFTYSQLPEFEIIGATQSSGCHNPDGALQLKAITPLDQLWIKGSSTPAVSLQAGETTTLPNLKSGSYTLVGTLGSCTNTLGTVVPLVNPPTHLAFDVVDIVPETCTATGKIDGSFTIQLSNSGVTGGYSIIDTKGNEVRNGQIGGRTAIPITLQGGKYFVVLFDDNDCNLPKSDEIDIPSLSQVTFEIPPNITICERYDFTPSNLDLAYKIIYPDNREVLFQPGEDITFTEAGEYSIIGNLPNQTDICPTLKTFSIEVVEPIDFEPKLIEEDCFGNRKYEADIFGKDPNSVVFTWYNEEGAVVGNGQFLFPVSYGEFKLDVQPANSNACPVPPKPIQIDEPVLSVDLKIKSTKLCELGPGAILNLAIDLPQAVTDISWRRFDADGNTEELPQFKDKKEIIVESPGIYEAAAFSIIPSIGKDCELGRTSITLGVTPDRVKFDIPTELTICESYEFTPSTTENLNFEVTEPNGNVVNLAQGESLTLNQNGTYSFFGFNPDLEYPLCPEIKTLPVTIRKKIDFQPVLVEEDCNGNKTYKAEIGSTNPEDAVFTWTDESGRPVGNEQFVTLNNYGKFSLDVQPKGSIPCDQEPVGFEVPAPVLSAEVNLIADPLCPDSGFATVRAESDFGAVSSIEWWYTTPSGEKSELTSERNKKEILAVLEGTYEVRTYNELPCLLGSDHVLIMQSPAPTTPVVEESYIICPKYEIYPTIDPGTYAAYEWYYQENLISTDPIFQPKLTGDYKLIAYSDEGCPVETNFTTVEECELKVMYPNAVQPGNPDKLFMVYTNYLIEELEVLIFNKWGELVFSCSQKNLLSEQSTCIWNGTYKGKSIPNGTYSVRMNYKNREKKISGYQFGTILIVE